MSDLICHSADVEMHLLLNGASFAISHMGPDYLRLRESVEHPPATGEVVLVIDGQESRWQVYFPQGISGQGRIPVEKVT
jgi:hypothetical protein